MKHQAVHGWLLRQTNLSPALLDGRAVEHLISERMRRAGATTEDEYLRHLGQDPREAEALIGGIAVGESWLFRYPASFDLLADHLRRHLVSAGPRPVRMLSVGCAAGQEPCSMMITAVHAGWAAADVNLDAVDPHREQIDQAQRGAYSASAVRGDLPPWAHRFVQRQGDRIQVDPAVTAAIRFRHGNALTIDDLPGGYAAVFCRNVLIYLSELARRSLVSRLAGWLSPDGLLFIGHADRTGAVTDRFDPVAAAGAFALRHAVATTPPPETPRKPRRRPPTTSTGADRAGRSEARRAADTPGATTARTPPTRRPPSLDNARALADQGRLDEALAATTAVLAADGPSAGALALLGAVHLAGGREDDARTCFRQVVYLEPDHEDALLQLALIHERRNEPQPAARYRRRAEQAHRRNLSSDEARDAG